MNPRPELRPGEADLLAQLRSISSEAGSHSPSRFTLQDLVPSLQIKIDACFLSNPYATDLFMDRLKSDMLDTGNLRDLLEFYPSQNSHIASLIASQIDVEQERVFVSNGAGEAIQAALHVFGGKRVAVILPTFSPYYEFLRPDQECFFYRLSSEDDFHFDGTDFVRFALENRVDTVCIINPNNPNGGYISSTSMRELLHAFSDMELVILDESFVEFAYEDELRGRLSLAPQLSSLTNVVLIKSMSKDFGIAGIRAGYAIMNPERVERLLSNGFLWNSSGLAEFFFRLFGEEEFQRSYAEVRLRYLDEAAAFFGELEDVAGIRPFSSKANFCLVRLDDTIPVDFLVPLLLVRHGVYVRDCRDKVGLEDGQYLRIAARTDLENRLILDALRQVIAECRTDQ